MSWHCLFCGCPENWMRGKERPKDSRMVELKIYRECSTKKIYEAVVHADCLRLVLKAGQKKHMHEDLVEGFEEFEELKKEAIRQEKD